MTEGFPLKSLAQKAQMTEKGRSRDFSAFSESLWR